MSEQATASKTGAGRRKGGGARRRTSLPPEVAAFAVQLLADRSCREVSRMLRDRFGSLPGDSKSALARLASRELGQDLDRRLRMKPGVGRDQEVVSFVLDRAAGRSYRELEDLCVERFGPDRAPSRSAVRGLVRQAERKRGVFRRCGSTPWFEKDREVLAFVLSLPIGLSVGEVVRLCQERFGGARTPSNSSVARFFEEAERRGNVERPFGPPCKVFRDLDVLVFVFHCIGKMPLDQIRALGCRTFGAARMPSRSAIGRMTDLSGPKRRFLLLVGAGATTSVLWTHGGTGLDLDSAVQT